MNETSMQVSCVILNRVDIQKLEFNYSIIYITRALKYTDIIKSEIYEFTWQQSHFPFWKMKPVLFNKMLVYIPVLSTKS